MRRAPLAAMIAAAVAATPSASAHPQQAPPRVCEGLAICVPVGGPWVVVPGPARGATTGGAVWQLSCPPSLGVVGGVDVRVANRWIDVFFPGRIGSPVNPGITTGNAVVFTAVSVGPPGRASSFLPFVGCIPAQGGQRVPTGVSVHHEFRPGGPLVRRVSLLEVRPGRPARGTLACKPEERLISAQTAIGIYTALPPRPAQLRSVRVTRSIRRGRIVVTAVRHGLASTIATDVQIHAVCAERLAG